MSLMLLKWLNFNDTSYPNVNPAPLGETPQPIMEKKI